MNAIQVIAYIGFVAAILTGMVCVLTAMVNMCRTVMHRKPGIPLFSSWWESPFNILFRPEQLTGRGLAARRWCFYGVAGFVACYVLAAAFGLIAGVANW